MTAAGSASVAERPEPPREGMALYGCAAVLVGAGAGAAGSEDDEDVVALECFRGRREEEEIEDDDS